MGRRFRGFVDFLVVWPIRGRPRDQLPWSSAHPVRSLIQTSETTGGGGGRVAAEAAGLGVGVGEDGGGAGSRFMRA